MKCYSLAFWAGMETAVTLKLFQSAKSAVWKGKCMGKKNESLYNWNWLLYDCVLFCKQVFLKLFLWCLGKWKGHNDEHSQL